MDFKNLANRAKKEFDKAGGTEKLKSVQDKAKAAYDERGGAEGLKASAKHVVDAAKGEGSVGDKAKAAAAAAKEEAAKPKHDGDDVVEGKTA